MFSSSFFFFWYDSVLYRGRCVCEVYLFFMTFLTFSLNVSHSENGLAKVNMQPHTCTHRHFTQDTRSKVRRLLSLSLVLIAPWFDGYHLVLLHTHLNILTVFKQGECIRGLCEVEQGTHTHTYFSSSVQSYLLIIMHIFVVLSFYISRVIKQARYNAVIPLHTQMKTHN